MLNLRNKLQSMRLHQTWQSKRNFFASLAVLVVAALMCLFPLPKPTWGGGGALAESSPQDPTISISASGLINLNLSAGGTTASNSTTITTATTNYTGYNLYLSAKDNNNKMTLIGGTSSDVIESITSSITETSDAFENRWGYKIDSAVNYNPIPTVQTQIAFSTSASTGDTKTLSLAAKASKTKAQGAYVGELTLTAVANSSKVYSITYNKNTTDTVGSFPTNITQTTTQNNTVTISNNTPTRDGYNFISWCTSQVADGESCTGTAYEPGDSITLSPTTSNAISLYAVWERFVDTRTLADIQNMQDINPDICENTAIATSTTGTYQLKDTRDNTIYSVAKLDDGNCWMTQNLTLGSTTLGSKVLTSADSDVSSDFTLPAPTTTSFSSSNYNVKNYRNYTSNSTNYYNWYTATAGTGTRTISAYTAASSSICPKGWRLPNGSSASSAAGEWAELFYAAGITSSLATDTYATGGAAKRAAAPYNIPNTYGYFNTTGTAPTSTSYTYFWTNRTYSSTSYAWSTYIGSSSATLNYGSRYKYQGMPMRCVAHKAETKPTITYNANGGTGSIASQTAASASEFSQSFTLSDGTGMTRTDHDLVGWSTDPNATLTTMEYRPGQTIATTSSLNLYAVWYDVSNLTTFDSAFASAGKSKDTTTNLYKMQDMSSTICGNVTNTEITIYAVSTQLVDTRDNKIYWVSKLKDGNCWMTQNLDYDIKASGNEVAVIGGTTTTWNSSYPPHATETTRSSHTEYTDTYSWDPGDYYVENGGGFSACTTWRPTSACGSTKAAVSLTSTDAKDNQNLHYHLGNYYQWNTATAGYGGTETSKDIDYSICPQGWRLPTSNSYTNNYSFGKLTNAYGITNSATGSSDADLIKSPLWFVRAGIVYDSSLNDQGTSGSVWSSRAYWNSNYAYELGFDSSSVDPSIYYYNRYDGFSARCVAE